MTREEAKAKIKTIPVWIPGPCPWCGATTLDEAGDKCTPTQDQTGDYSCGTPDSAPDTNGLIHILNPEYAELEGYLIGWHAVDEGYTKNPPKWRDEK